MHNKNQLIVGFNFNHMINNLKIAELVLNRMLLKYSACGVMGLYIILPVCITGYLEMVRGCRTAKQVKEQKVILIVIQN